MKFFHLSDLHIGLKLFNRDLREDQEYILRQITDSGIYFTADHGYRCPGTAGGSGHSGRYLR